MTWPELLKKHIKELEVLKDSILVLISAVQSNFTGSIEISFTQGGVAGKTAHNKIK